MKKTYTSVTPIEAESRLGYIRRILCSTLFPLYCLGAHRHGIPGLRFASESARLAFRSLFAGREGVAHGEIYRMLFTPVESTRYFEFGMAWDFLSGLSIDRYLDVSSPRLFPVTLMVGTWEVTAE